ncbi:hypothetical protein GCM10020220_000320 [Nonomuraea rubra]|uniref:hypothetical protein n=1 Tax=Nonomuraea rubra TaxID=46180 RepID=UPI0033732A99
MNAYVGGQLTWKERRHTVRTPVVVRPVPEKWAATYGVAGGQDSAEFIVNDPAGKRVYVTGASYGAHARPAQPEHRHRRLRRRDRQGAVEQDLRRPCGQLRRAVRAGADPRREQAARGGISAGTETGTDAVTLAYDAASGEPLWTARYTAANAHSDHANAVKVAPDGRPPTSPA